MHPVHDVDAVLLLSLSVAAKRRPADLVEIVTAIALAQGAIPHVLTLADAFARLSACGLLVETNEGYTLSDVAQKMLASQRKKDDNEKKLSRLKEHLADYRLKGEHPAISISQDQLLAAVQAYQAARKISGRSLLASKPKPKPAWIPGKDLAQGKQQLPSHRRKPKSP